MRGFIALDLPAALTRALAYVGTEMHAPSIVRLTPAERMHLTLAFLGEMADESVDAIGRELATLTTGVVGPPLLPRQLELFSSAARATVVVVAFADSDGALLALQSDVAALARRHGFVLEERAFRAHVTLGRLRTPTDLRRWRSDAQSAVEVALAGIAVARAPSVTLYRSDQGPEGPRYTALTRCPLTA
jgi:2'-5' RNA ligase